MQVVCRLPSESSWWCASARRAPHLQVLLQAGDGCRVHFKKLVGLLHGSRPALIVCQHLSKSLKTWQHENRNESHFTRGLGHLECQQPQHPSSPLNVFSISLSCSASCPRPTQPSHWAVTPSHYQHMPQLDKPRCAQPQLLYVC